MAADKFVAVKGEVVIHLTKDKSIAQSNKSESRENHSLSDTAPKTQRCLGYAAEQKDERHVEGNEEPRVDRIVHMH